MPETDDGSGTAAPTDKEKDASPKCKVNPMVRQMAGAMGIPLGILDDIPGFIAKAKEFDVKLQAHEDLIERLFEVVNAQACILSDLQRKSK